MKKVISLFTAAALSLALFSGCASTKAPTSTKYGKDSKVTITYGLWDSNEEVGLKKVAQAFEKKNPNITIKFQLSSWANYWTMLDAAATGGTLPDTFWIHSNYIYKYTSNGMLHDLTSVIKQSKDVKLSNFPSGLTSIYNYKGKQYAVPKDYDTIGLWYNKTMFKKAGIKYPDSSWTWTTLYNAAKKLTDGKGHYGFLAPLKNQEGYYNFIYQNGGTVLKNSNGKKTSGYDDPKTIKAMDYYLSFVKNGLSPKVYDDLTPTTDMENGMVAMCMFGSWNISGFMSNSYMAKNCDVAVLPKSSDGKRATIFNGLGEAIAFNTKHFNESWKWVDYLSSKEGQLLEAKYGVAISAYNGTANEWTNATKPFNSKIFIDQVKYAVIRPYSQTTGTWEDKSYEQLKGAWTGAKSVTQACKDAAAAMNKILATEK